MRRATQADLPYVQPIKRKNGTKRYFFRRKGYPRMRIPGSPGSVEFIAAYNKALSLATVSHKPRGTAKTGTLAALIDEYQGSARFNRMAVSTKRETGYVLKTLVKTNGDILVETFEPKHIERWVDGLQKKPGAANKMLRVVRILMRFAVKRGYRWNDPTLGIDLLKLGEHRPWTQQELSAFETYWPLGSLERTGFALALYSGQRRADLTGMKFADIAGGTIRVRQSKTSSELIIPIHPNLAVVLAAVRPRHESAILATEKGKPLSPYYFGHRMADAIDDAGLPRACVLHGLRKSAAVALIDAGCTEHQAMAITGHQSPRMLAHYVKGRDQAKLAGQAIVKWKRAKNKR